MSKQSKERILNDINNLHYAANSTLNIEARTDNLAREEMAEWLACRRRVQKDAG